jgi:hypothetical protein
MRYKSDRADPTLRIGSCVNALKGEMMGISKSLFNPAGPNWWFVLFLLVTGLWVFWLALLSGAWLADASWWTVWQCVRLVRWVLTASYRQLRTLRRSLRAQRAPDPQAPVLAPAREWWEAAPAGLEAGLALPPRPLPPRRRRRFRRGREGDEQPR